MGRIRTVNPNLPARMLARTSRNSGAVYYYYSTYSLDRKEIALGSDLSFALSKYEYLEKHKENKIQPVPDNYVKHMFRTAKKNAKSRGIEFNLTIEELNSIFEKSKGKCSLTGIKFTMEKSNYRMPPWIPSLDRINSDLGYSIDNCRLVCCAVNLALNQFGFDVLKKISMRLKNVEHSNFAEHSNNCGAL